MLPFGPTVRLRPGTQSTGPWTWQSLRGSVRKSISIVFVMPLVGVGSMVSLARRTGELAIKNAIQVIAPSANRVFSTASRTRAVELDRKSCLVHWNLRCQLPRSAAQRQSPERTNAAQ